MIKKIIKIFFTLLFFLIKKIFIRKNRVQHKIMDSLANKLHSIFLFTSFCTLYLSLLDFKIYSINFSSIIYTLLFFQFVIIIRYFNPKLLKEKKLQSNIVNKISRLSLIIFIFNWVVFSFSFAILFILITVMNIGLYVFIIKQVNKQKEQEEFKKQFGDGDYTKEDIINKHILNLFESNIDQNQLIRSEIKKQYRLMAKKYHPDVYKGDDKEKFASINSSYKFLLNLIK